MKLRALLEKDMPLMLEWMRDPELSSFFQFDPSKITEETALRFIKNSMSADSKNFAIVEENDEYLGTISLKNINQIHHNAEYAIGLRKKAIGSGISKLATEEVIRIAFQELNLNRIYLNVLSDNVRAIKFYEKVGFEFEGEFREHLKIANEYRNLKWFAIVRNKYEKNN